jgi:hypothetical protein
VWQAKFSGALPRTNAQPALYMVLGGHQLQAAVYAAGQWQCDTTIDIRSGLAGADERSQNVALLDTLLAFSSDVSIQQAAAVRLGTFGMAMHVAVAERWLPCDTVPWSSALETADTQAAILAHMQQAGLNIQPEDTVRYEQAPWGCARWAVAYPAALLQALAQCAQGLNGHLASVVPMASLALQQLERQMPGARLVAYTDAQGLNLVEVEQGRVLSVLQRPIPVSLSNDQPATTASVIKVWRSIQLRSPQWESIAELPLLSEAANLGMSSEKGLNLIAWPAVELGSTAPQVRALREFTAHSHPLNAVPARRRTTTLQAILIAAAVALLALLAWKVTMNAQTIWQMEKLASTPSENTTPNVPSTLNKAQQDQVAADNAAIRQLNLPVAQLLSALQPPKDIRVALLGIDLSDGAGGSSAAKFKLNAETLSGEEMTRYVGFLTTRKPFVNAYLVRHEVMQNMPELPWRFTLELTWQP